MATEEELREKYTGLETVDLLHIMAHKNDYTDVAVSVASEELTKRKVPQNEIDDYQSQVVEQKKQVNTDNYFIDLSLFQKIGNYFLIIPLVKLRFRWLGMKSAMSDGYALKYQQQNYYSIVGFSLFVVSILSTNLYRESFLYIWISGFLVAYLFDVGYNKNRQIYILQEKVEQGIDPFQI
jgi:hypothetical protein